MPIGMMNVRLSTGFSIKVAKHLRDPMNDDLPLFDIYGPLQAVRAAWARLISRKTYSWELGGQVKLNKIPGHILLKTETPNGWANWTFVSRQAVPTQLDPSFPTYCWTEQFSSRDPYIMPDTFIPILMAAMPFPILSEWKDYLWSEGTNRRVIIELRKATNVTGFKILPNLKVWEAIIKEGFTSQQIFIDEPLDYSELHDLPESTPEEPQYIDVYTRKQAIEDEQQYDANIEPFSDVTRQHYKWPVFMSRDVYWLMKESTEAEGSWTDFKGIWHDILTISHSYLAKDLSSRRKSFDVWIRDKDGKEKEFGFISETGPMDLNNPDPCVYIKLENELD